MSKSTHFLILIDEDRRQFTVEGPLCDAQPWSRAVDKAQEDGRKVKCCDIGSTSLAEAIAEWQHRIGSNKCDDRGLKQAWLRFSPMSESSQNWPSLRNYWGFGSERIIRGYQTVE